MIIGFDTSCYTTSLAICHHGKIVYQRRLLLNVKPGTCGLRQSEAVFQHIRNLPRLFDELPTDVTITGVSVSDRPRPVEGSYLPVFTVGASFGESVARLFNVPLIKTSHQEGHLRAALLEPADWLNPGTRFLAWHISGGTTELLKAVSLNTGFQIEKIGGTSDLQVGQFIDRVGVLLGTSFPAGPHLEKMALQFEGKTSTCPPLPVVTRDSDLTISFSGPDSAAERLIHGGTDGPGIALRVFECIGKSLFRVTLAAVKQTEIPRVLFVGGVASNRIIRDYIGCQGEREGIQTAFGSPELSSDNAVGVALIGDDAFRRGLEI